MKKVLTFALFCILSTGCLFSQPNKKLWGELNLGYGLSLAENGGKFDFSYDNLYGKMNLMHVSLKGGCYLTPLFSIGVGFGLNGYHNPDINTFPVFVDLRYHLKPLPKLYFFADIGASVLSSADFTSGFLSDIGAGYRFPWGKGYH